MTFKINFNKIRVFASGLIRFLTEHSFLFFVGLICLSLFFAVFLLYRYEQVSTKLAEGSSETAIKLDQDSLQSVLQAWQSRETELEQAGSESYIDPFF